MNYRRLFQATTRNAVLVLIGICITSCGCFNRSSLPGQLSTKEITEALKQIDQTPVSPAPRPAPRRKTARAQSPATPKPAPEPEEPAVKPGFTPDNLDLIHSDMSKVEVNNILGQPGLTVSGDETAMEILKWESEGIILYAKFENGKLVRSNMMVSDRDLEPAQEKKRELNRKEYNRITNGMPIEDALDILDVEPQLISQSGKDTQIYKWEDEKGSSFTARFENGRLVRKTGMYVAPQPEETAPEADGADGEAPAPPSADAAAQAPPVPEKPAPRPYDSPYEAQEKATPPQQQQVQRLEPQQRPVRESTPPTAPERKRVFVVGTGREDSGESENSRERYERQRKAKLPDFTYSIRGGNYEVRVVNNGNSTAEVGLRSGKYGADLKVPPGGSRSVKVNQGSYQMHYIFDDNPYELGHGESMNIDGMLLSDVLVTLYDDGADIGVLDYGRYR